MEKRPRDRAANLAAMTAIETVTLYVTPAFADPDGFSWEEARVHACSSGREQARPGE